MRKLATAAVPLLLLSMMAALRVSELRTARAEALRTAEGRAANLALMTSTYLGEAFASTDAALRQLVLHAQRIGGPGAPSSEWLPSLDAARAGVPIGAISVTDASGAIRHSTLQAIVGESRRDEGTFRALMAAPGDALIAGAPFPTVDASPRVIIPLGRKLTDASGRVTGAVIASFVPGAPQDFLRSVDVGRQGALWVFHPDGVLLYHEPSAIDRAGEHAAAHPVFVEARRHGRGRLRAALAPDGAVKLTAYETRANPPLITAISLDEAEVLAPWRQGATRAAMLFGVFSVMLIAGLVVLLREMAARDEVLQREQRARRDAEDANSFKDQFLMTLSHELRTPLTAIRGWARMLALGAVDERGRIKAVQAIERNAAAQERLIEDLLDVSRVMGGKLALRMQPVQVAQIAQLALETVRPAADAKGVGLEVAIDGNAGTVSGDPERLQQVIWNLLSNAMKFTDSGGRVRLDVRRDGRHVQIVVSDGGAGISRDFLPHVFERFRQEDASTTRKHGGLGLGLAIVRSLVEMHGGSVAAHSDGPGRGARFQVTLPILASSPAAEAGIGDPVPTTGLVPPGYR
jgi:signal transduction histidine kinase